MNLIDAMTVAEAVSAAYGTEILVVGRARGAVHLSDEDQNVRVLASHAGDALRISILAWREEPAHVTFGDGQRYLADPQALARLLPRF